MMTKENAEGSTLEFQRGGRQLAWRGKIKCLLIKGLLDEARRRRWHPTPVFLPGESQGWRSLVGCRLWGRTESDMTETT